VFQAVAFPIYLYLVLRHQHPGIFREIDATFVAIAAMGLDVGAGWTLIAKGRMAAAAEYIRIACFDAALGALHSVFILAVATTATRFLRGHSPPTSK
jgi:hypothetical protein